ncbi:MAG: hypothetical protein SRB2_04872 [Desulfobacteraceae bacterium Eth-SRB2]|nr:MAG: hypothetical protein SRB2_04872 [Desulfobacteraceae bacterium Eth-SRB2]
MTHNEAETRYFLIDSILCEKGYGDHQWLKLETPAPVEPTGPKGRQLTFNQQDLARELGVSYATVNCWKNGQAKPSKLARAQLGAFCERMQEAGMLTLPEAGCG